MGEIHSVVGDGETASYDETDLREKLTSGEVDPNTPCWREGLKTWQPLGEVLTAPPSGGRSIPAQNFSVGPESRRAQPMPGEQRYLYTKDPTGLTRWLKVMLWLYLAMVVVSILSDLGQMFLLSGNGYTIEQANANDLRQQIVIWIYLGVFLLTTVPFGMWVYRMSSNCAGFGGAMEYSPGWAVGSYFVPILNLFRPYQAMQEIWEVSRDPMSRGTDGGTLVRWWWGFWLLSRFGGAILGSAQTGAETVETLQTATIYSIISSGIDIPLTLVALAMVGRIADMQRALVTQKS